VSSVDQCIVEPLWKVNYLDSLGNVLKKNGRMLRVKIHTSFSCFHSIEIVSSG
jgi:hypothetical protein